MALLALASLGGEAHAQTCATSGDPNITTSCSLPSQVAAYVYGTLTIGPSAIVTAGTLDSTTPVTIHATNLAITGSITVAGRSPVVPASTGAGHGGLAGGDNGVAFDSATGPTMVGIGGGGGRGGGALRIVVSGQLTINGAVIADGANGAATGGGAGGAIWITTNNLAGTGSIRAQGGTASGVGRGGGGGRVALEYTTLVASPTVQNNVTAFGGDAVVGSKGGAGTVFIRAAGNSGTLTIDNGTIDGAGTRFDPAGQPGTFDSVVMKRFGRLTLTSGQTLTATNGIPTWAGAQARVTVDLGATLVLPSAVTMTGWDLVLTGTLQGTTALTIVTATVISNGTYSPGLSSLTVGSSGTFDKVGTNFLQIGAITVASGGKIQHAANTTGGAQGADKSHQLWLKATTIDVQSGGTITAVDKGYNAQQGFGWLPGGAGHGGLAGGDLGRVTGSPTAPETLGAGGTIVKGGGAIRLEVSNLITVNGSIAADGTAGGVSPNAGSAGGSIRIDTLNIAGSGTITASGGSGCATCAGGGGGRIAVAFTTITSGNVLDLSAARTIAYGGNTGAAATGGGAGTVVLDNRGTGIDTLTVDQGNSLRGNTPILANEGYDSVLVRGGAKLVVPSGTSLTIGSQLAGGGTTRGALIVASGGTLATPATFTVNGVDVTHQGHWYVSVLTLVNSIVTWDGGSFDSVLANLVLGSAGIFEQRSLSAFAVGQLDVSSGGSYRSGDNTTATLTHQVYVDATTINVLAGGSISASARGYPVSTGAGFFNLGAGHGGLAGGDRGAVTDSVTAPAEPGAGGTTGKGGGVVWLDADTITVSGTGTIDANGANGAAGSGGAGGAVFLMANTLSGNGSVSANGGTGSTYSGGGGRVALQYQTKSGFTGAMLATSPTGGAGSVYLQRTVAPLTEELIIDNNGVAAGSTRQTLGEQSYQSVLIKGGAKYVIPAGATLTPTTLTGATTPRPSLVIQTGGTLALPSASYPLNNLDLILGGVIDSTADVTLTNLTLALTAGADFVAPLNLDVASGAVLEQQHVGPVSGIGNLTISTGTLRHADNTTGTMLYSVDIGAVNITLASGATVNVANRGFPAGGNGAHAGLNGGNGGTAYGSADQPTTLGLGFSGKGGGAIKLRASGTLTVNTAINADGQSVGGCAHGAAGGSVWLVAGALAGTGTVTTRGGYGGNCGTQSGGGGRIAVYYDTVSGSLLNGSSLLASAQVSGGSTPGGAGTVVLVKTSAPTSRTLIVDNFNAAGTTTPQSGTSESYDVVTIRGDASVTVGSGKTLTVTSALTGGATNRGALSILTGGRLVAPSAALAVTDLDVGIHGTLDTVTDLTLTRSIFTFSGTITNPIGALVIGPSAVFEQQKVGPVTVDTLDVLASGTLRSGDNPGATKVYEVNIAARAITVAGTVTAAARGAQTNSGPGYSGGVAAHAGMAGNNGGSAHGSVESPSAIGSTVASGRGGGAIKLSASETLTINGPVTSDATSAGGCNHGPSGGSVWLVTSALAGTGAVSAKGGAGGNCGTVGGGGGRVAVHYASASGTVLNNLSANTPSAAGQTPGGAGTIFINKTSAPATRTLIIDNFGVGAANTPQVGASETYDVVTVRGDAAATVPSGKTLTVTSALNGGATARASLSILVGGTLVAPSAALVISDLDVGLYGTLDTVTDLTLTRSNFYFSGTFTNPIGALVIGTSALFEQQKVGPVTVDTLDVLASGTLRSGDNPGATKVYEVNVAARAITVAGTVTAAARGAQTNSGPGYSGGVAAHAGLAGNNGGSAHGSVESPSAIGSTVASGRGGGAIKLSASETLTINGPVTSDASSAGGCNHGPSGGSVWLITNALAGTGAVSARGGAGGNCGTVGGGGGRVAVHYASASGTVLDNLSANTPSATGQTSGGAGTVFVNKTSAPTYRTLIVDNLGVSAQQTPQTTTAETFDTLIVRGLAYYVIGSGKTTTITTALTGATSRGTLQVSAGGTVVSPSAALTVVDLDVVLAGTMQTTTDLTLTRSNFYFSGTFANPIGALVIGTSAVFEQQKVGPVTVDTLDVHASGTLRSGDNPGATKVYEVNVAARAITVAGTVTAAARGAQTNSGPGYSGGVAAHAGLAGNNGGSAHGSVESPVDIGSTVASGRGGGVIKLSASETLTINGPVTSDATSAGGCNHGPSGGSVWLVTSALAGTGTVSAKGGAGGNCGTVGGGGGRVAVHYASASGTLLDNLSANTPSATGQTSGGAGTVFVNKTSAPLYRTLTVDNFGGAAQQTPQRATSESYDTLIVRGLANYVIGSGKTTTITTALNGGATRGTLTVSAGGMVVSPSAALTVVDLDVVLAGTMQATTDLTLTRSSFYFSGAFTPTLQSLVIGSSGMFEQQKLGPINVTTLEVQSDGVLRSGDNTTTTKDFEVNFAATDINIAGAVTTSGRGYPANSGPGYSGGGAGHGGYGGSGTGALHGSVTAPADMGSSALSKGGGVVKLLASNTLTLNGTVTADANHSGGCNNGGAGGSIWLVTKSLIGAGSGSARGGVGGNCGTVSGGGGRIAIHYETVTGAVLDAARWLAHSPTGGGTTTGGPGTVYYRKIGAPTRDTLIYDNSGAVGGNARLVSATESYTNLTLRGGVTLALVSGQRLDLATDGALTGQVGATSRPVLSLATGAILSLPLTTPIDTLDLTLNGEVRQLRTLSLKTSSTLWNPTNVLPLGALTLDSASTFTKSGPSKLTIEGPLLVKSGGTLTHTANAATQAHLLDIKAISVDVQAGGAINANARGFVSQSGPGAGGSGTFGGGGGHGGAGGRGGNPSTVGGAGGAAYGDEVALLGSAGGDDTGLNNQQGGTGGGSIALQVCGDLIVNGSITANAANGLANYGGGGAGGTVKFTVAALTGNGTISANGGNGASVNTSSGGGGGGGRVSPQYQTSTFSGTMSARGGTRAAGTTLAVAGADFTITPTITTAGDLCPEYACAGGTCGATWDPVAAACTYEATNGVACSDNNLCTSGEVCAAGVCGSGTTVSCDDGIACTTDTCSPTSGCQNPNAPSSTPCNDNNPCTANDHCSAGACVSGGTTNCNDSDACTNDSCQAGVGCVNTPKTCNALDQCHVAGTCNPQNGVCNNPNKPNGTSCSDNSVCTTGDACQSGACSGATVNCDDGNACSLDSCSAQTGCVNTPRSPTITPAIANVTLLDDVAESIDLDDHDRDCFGNAEASGLVWSIQGGDAALLTFTLDADNLLELVPVETASTWSVTLTLILTDALGGFDTQSLTVTHTATPFVLTLVADPATLVADGSATATVTATLTSPVGLSVGARKVTFTTLSGPDRVVTTNVYTDPSGVATTTIIAGTTAVTSTIRGRVVANEGTFTGTTPVAATLPGPDLTVGPSDIAFYLPGTNTRVYPGALNPTDPGATLDVRVTVHNSGGSATPAGLRLDLLDAVVADGSLGGEHLVASATLPAIAAQGAATLTLSVTFPEAGFHSLVAFADAADALAEGHEDDNSAAAGFWIGPPAFGDIITTECHLASDTIGSGGLLETWGRADYTPFLPFDPDHSRAISAVKGGLVSLAVIDNVGQPVNIGSWIPVIGDTGNNRALHTIGQWPFKPVIGRYPNRGATDRWGFPGPTALGQYTLRTCVTDVSFTGCCDLPFEVVPAGPDLACSTPILPGTTEAAPIVGIPTNLRTTIANHGDVTVTNARVRLRVDGVNVSDQFVTLAPNATTVLTFPWTPACSTGQVSIVVDPDDQINEREEDDNTCRRSTPDLRLGAVGASNVRACQLDLGLQTSAFGGMPVASGWSSTMIATRPDGSTTAAGASFDTSSQPGTWRFDATVDTPITLPGTCGIVPESSELANNVASVTVCPNPSPWRNHYGPNAFGAVDLIAVPLPVRYGESTTIVARITNYGSLTFQEDLPVNLTSNANAVPQVQTIVNSCADGIEPGQAKDVSWVWTPIYVAGNEPRLLRVTTGDVASCRDDDRETTKGLALDLFPDLAASAPQYGAASAVVANIFHAGSIAPNGEGANARVAFVRKNGDDIEHVDQAIVRPIVGAPETISWAWTPSACVAGDDTMDGLRVTTDTSGVYAEASEGNNVAVLHLPDLVPTAVTQAPDGCGTRFTFHVQNQSPIPSLGVGQWYARLVLTRPDGVALAPIVGGPYNGVGAFPIGAQVDTSMSGAWTANITVDTGTASAGCGDIPEYRESNNVFETTLSLCPDPSPQVTGLAIIAAGDPQLDHEVTLTAYVRNAGTTAIAHPVSLKLTTDTYDPDTSLPADTVTLPVDCTNPLMPGETRPVNIGWTPRRVNRPRTLFVTTDPVDVYPGECNEGNNVASRGLWLDLSPWRDQRGPNYLGAIDVGATPSTPAWNAAQAFDYQIFNRLPPGDSSRLILVPDGGADALSITTVRRVSGAELPADTSFISDPRPSDPQEVTLAWSPNATLCNPDDGLEELAVDVDALDYFDEDREDNNDTVRPFPDLVLSGPSLAAVNQSHADLSFGVGNAAPSPALGLGSWSARATITRPDGSNEDLGPLAYSGGGTKLLVDELYLNQNGHWHIEVRGDTEGGACGVIPEANERNNDSAADFDLCPDVGVVLLPPGPLAVGVPVPITVRLRNDGNLTLVEDISVVLESDPPGAALTLDLAATQLVPLAPGSGLDPDEHATVTWMWTPNDAFAVSALRATAVVLDTVATNGTYANRECGYNNNTSVIPTPIPYGCKATIALPSWRACDDGDWSVTLRRPSGAVIPSAQITSLVVHFEDTTELIATDFSLLPLAGNPTWQGVIDLPGEATHAGVAAFVEATLADGSSCGASATTLIAPGTADLNIFSDDIDFVSKNGNTAFFNQANVNDELLIGLQMRNGPQACLATNVNGNLVLNLGFDQIVLATFHIDAIQPNTTVPINLVAVGNAVAPQGNGRFEYVVTPPSPWLDVFEVNVLTSDNVDVSVADNTATRSLMVGQLGQGNGECNCLLQGPLTSFPAGEPERVRFRLTTVGDNEPVLPAELARLAMFLTIDDASAVDPIDLLDDATYEGDGVYEVEVTLPAEQSGETVQLAIVAGLTDGGSCDAVAARAVNDACDCDDYDSCTEDGCDEDGSCEHTTLPATPGTDATCDGIDDNCDDATDEDYAPSAAACTETDVCLGAMGVARCQAGVVVVDCDSLWLDIAEQGDATCAANAPVVYAIVNDRQGNPAGTIRCHGDSRTCDTDTDGVTLTVYDGLMCPGP